MGLTKFLRLALLASAAEATICNTDSQPNPIYDQYPNDSTGTINGTVAIIPIPYSQARSIIPSEYPILEKAYRELLPWFPKGMYPAMLQTEFDHDVRTGDIRIPDFHRFTISFPFVDRLNDGYTSMTYGDNILISASNPLAIAGAAAYGNHVTPARYVPDCNAENCVEGTDCKTAYVNIYTALGAEPVVSQNFTQVHHSPYDMHFWLNVTNQPQCADNKLFCDNYIRMFNQSVTTGQYEPKNVRGKVFVSEPYFQETSTFTDVYGLQMDNAFIERNYVSCDSVQGYTYSEPS